MRVWPGFARPQRTGWRDSASQPDHVTARPRMGCGAAAMVANRGPRAVLRKHGGTTLLIAGGENARKNDHNKCKEMLETAKKLMSFKLLCTFCPSCQPFSGHLHHVLVLVSALSICSMFVSAANAKTFNVIAQSTNIAQGLFCQGFPLCGHGCKSYLCTCEPQTNKPC